MCWADFIMRPNRSLWIVFLCLALAARALSGCTLSDQPPSSPGPVTSLPDADLSPTPDGQDTQAAASPLPPSLRTDPGPFTDAAWLLDGVCFEYLAQMDGERWTWTAEEDMNDFFDRVDDSKLCGIPVPRPTFDFTDAILVGAVQTAQGCDAAHRVVNVLQDDRAQTRTLVVALDVQPGCPYDLVQLFLVAVPRLPPSYTTQIIFESESP
jgi:hypothetical protein